mmetsp:Transcript_755/g.1383  ORF Transcript_755/g.1383 Transcript_755/m.1383 type:complete len:339 (+) Transcript_755:127-1143(+)
MLESQKATSKQMNDLTSKTRQPRPHQNTLESDITLDADICTIDVCAIQAHINIGSPIIVLPLNIQAIIGLQGGSQGTVITKSALPCNRYITIAIQSRRDAVVCIKLLRDSHLLVVTRSSELHIGVVHLMVNNHLLVVSGGSQLNVGVVNAMLDINLLVVSRGSELDIGITIFPANNNISLFINHIVSWVESDSGTIHVQTLGGFNTFHTTCSRCHNVEGEISILIVSIKLKSSIITLSHVALSSGRDSPATGNVRACFSPDSSWEGGDVSRWTSIGFNAIVNIDVSRVSRTFPADGGVQAVNSVEIAVSHGNRKLWASSRGDASNKSKVGNGKLHGFG